MQGNTIANAQENNSLAASFIHLKLRRWHKEDYVEVGESKAGTGLPDS